MTHMDLKSRLIGFLHNNNSLYLRSQSNANSEGVVKKGYLLIQKNMKKYFFVLRKATSETESSRLEYYNSENKFKNGSQPKKTYILNDCFNISLKTEKKKFLIALYINKMCIGLLCKTEDEMKGWLQNLKLLRGAFEEHEHIWPVEVLSRSTIRIQNLLGHHWLCLTSCLLSLVSVDSTNVRKAFQFTSIRKCGCEDKLFFLKLGRYSVTGEGTLYMQTENYSVARKIHSVMSNAMTNFKRTPYIAIGTTSKRRKFSDKTNYGSDIKPKEEGKKRNNGFDDEMVVLIVKKDGLDECGKETSDYVPFYPPDVEMGSPAPKTASRPGRLKTNRDPSDYLSMTPGPGDHTPSPLSTGSFPREISSGAYEEYMPIVSPDTEVSRLSQDWSLSSSPYVEMGPNNKTDELSSSPQWVDDEERIHSFFIV